MILLSFIELLCLVSFLNLIHDDIARFLRTNEKIALLVCVCIGETGIASSLLQESEKFNTCRAFNFCKLNGLNFCFRFLL